MNNTKKNSNIKKIIIITLCLILLIIAAILLIKSCNKAEEGCKEDYRQVGNDSYGYVCIPNDWVKFETEDSADGLRYSDINADYILTLEAVSTSEKTAEEYASEMVTGLMNIGIEAQISETKVKGYDAFKVEGLETNSNIYVSVYFFETKDNITHYIGIEGLDKNDEAFKIAETFIEKK